MSRLSKKAFLTYLDACGDNPCGEENRCPLATFLDLHGERPSSDASDLAHAQDARWACRFITWLDDQQNFCWTMTGNDAAAFLRRSGRAA